MDEKELEYTLKKITEALEGKRHKVTRAYLNDLKKQIKEMKKKRSEEGRKI